MAGEHPLESNEASGDRSRAANPSARSTGSGADRFLSRPVSAEGTFVPPAIIAEIGTGHGGDLTRARALIRAAADSGADIVKFQYVIAREILHPNTGTVPLPGGPVPLYEVFRGLEKPAEFYAELARECEAAGTRFLCTPFGLESARALADLGVEWFKIASPELNHHPLLRFVASTGLPVILSTGVSTLADIEESLAVLRHGREPHHGGREDRSDADTAHSDADTANPPDDRITLLHCVTAYPAAEEEYNLLLIRSLHGIFGVPTGVSDHSLDPVLVPAAAGALGARYVEKHFTLSRSGSGLDDPIAAEPREFARMRERFDAFSGTPNVEVLARLAEEYGENRVRAVLGSGVKTLAPGEAANYGRTNRSVHALRALAPGEILGEDSCAVLRTEKLLRPGLHPRYLETILGKRLSRAVPAGEGIVWEDLLQ